MTKANDARVPHGDLCPVGEVLVLLTTNVHEYRLIAHLKDFLMDLFPIGEVKNLKGPG